MKNNLLAYQLKGSGIQVVKDPVNTLELIISTVLGILTIVAVIYFTIQIIISGFSFMSSQGDPKAIDASKKKITNNILGLTIVVLAYGMGALISKILGINDVFNLNNVLTPIK